MKEKLDAGSKIRTYSGEYIDLFSDFDINQIKIEDIAHALSLMCRFGGHINMFYSVAEHSIWVANNLPKQHRLAGLLHDASEAYLVDIPSPIKSKLHQYKEIEDVIMKKIALKYNFQYPLSDEVKIADRKALEYEWEHFVIHDHGLETDRKKIKSIFRKRFIDIVNSEQK